MSIKTFVEYQTYDECPHKQTKLTFKFTCPNHNITENDTELVYVPDTKTFTYICNKCKTILKQQLVSKEEINTLTLYSQHMRHTFADDEIIQIYKCDRCGKLINKS